MDLLNLLQLKVDLHKVVQLKVDLHKAIQLKEDLHKAVQLKEDLHKAVQLKEDLHKAVQLKVDLLNGPLTLAPASEYNLVASEPPLSHIRTKTDQKDRYLKSPDFTASRSRTSVRFLLSLIYVQSVLMFFSDEF